MCSVNPYFQASFLYVIMSVFPPVHFSGVKLHVDSAQPSVFAVTEGNATMPCRFWYEPELSSPREVRVKWSWLPAAGGHEEDVLVAIGSRSRSCGNFRLTNNSFMIMYFLLCGCISLFSFITLCVVCCSGVECSSDRISQETLLL